MLPKVSSPLTYWPCLRHWSTSVKKPEQVVAQIIWRSRGGFSTLRNQVLQRCHQRSWCPDAHPRIGACPASVREHTPRSCSIQRVCWIRPGSAANSESCNLIKSKAARRDRGKGEPGLQPYPPPLPQAVLPGHSPQAANPAVAAAARPFRACAH